MKIAHDDGRELLAPTIHRNGTSAERLEEDLRAASEAVAAAVKAVEDARPNGRDYYFVEDGRAVSAVRRGSTWTASCDSRACARSSRRSGPAMTAFARPSLTTIVASTYGCAGGPRMVYGRPASGGRWHMVVGGRALCAGDAITLVEERPSEEVAAEDRCRNCDARLRELGRAKRTVVRHLPNRGVYRNRFKFEG